MRLILLAILSAAALLGNLVKKKNALTFVFTFETLSFSSHLSSK